MISLVDLFGLMSIAFAIFAIIIIVKHQNNKEQNSAYVFSRPDEHIDSFIDIPMEHLENLVDNAEEGNVETLKDKIERFKIRNRFYNL